MSRSLFKSWQKETTLLSVPKHYCGWRGLLLVRYTVKYIYICVKTRAKYTLLFDFIVQTTSEYILEIHSCCYGINAATTLILECRFAAMTHLIYKCCILDDQHASILRIRISWKRPFIWLLEHQHRTILSQITNLKKYIMKWVKAHTKCTQICSSKRLLIWYSMH